jgi:ABC-type transport system involved in multi-copper enzyme maturation permease subunit
MRSLLLKIFWETRWPVLLFGLGLALVMGLLTALLPRVLGDIHLVFEKLPFVKPLITALLGVDPGKQLTAAMSQAFLWVHPTVLSLIWAHEVMYCTRMPASEIDRGTIDFLLGLPISRWQLFVAESVGWLVSGLFVLGCGFLGHWIVEQVAKTEMRPAWSSTIYVMINLLSVYLAVGSFSFLVSALSDRRNRAIGVIFAVLLFSFLINFVAQFWDPLSGSPKPYEKSPLSAVLGVNNSESQNSKSPTQEAADDAAGKSALPASKTSSSWSIASFSVMHYYRPANVIQTGKFPTLDVSILVGFACLSWLTAGYYLSRRSICTV